MVISWQKLQHKADSATRFTQKFGEEFPRTAYFLEEWRLSEAYCMGLDTYHKMYVKKSRDSGYRDMVVLMNNLKLILNVNVV